MKKIFHVLKLLFIWLICFLGTYVLICLVPGTSFLDEETGKYTVRGFFGFASAILPAIAIYIHVKKKCSSSIISSIKGKLNLQFKQTVDYSECYNKTPTEEKPDSLLPPKENDDAQSSREAPVPTPQLNRELILLQKHRIALQNFNDKLKSREKEVEERERISIDRIRSASSDLEKYSNALYETEYRIIDYAKRIDKKEISLFEEIQENAKKFELYNSNPSKDGFQFERSFAEILQNNGFYNVIVTQQSNDFGADITAEKDGVKYVIQCKYYTSAVGIEAVQQIYSAKVHYGAHVAVVATNSVFTHAAKVLAEESGVLLWDCEKIASMSAK